MLDDIAKEVLHFIFKGLFEGLIYKVSALDDPKLNRAKREMSRRERRVSQVVPTLYVLLLLLCMGLPPLLITRSWPELAEIWVSTTLGWALAMELILLLAHQLKRSAHSIARLIHIRYRFRMTTMLILRLLPLLLAAIFYYNSH